MITGVLDLKRKSKTLKLKKYFFQYVCTKNHTTCTKHTIQAQPCIHAIKVVGPIQTLMVCIDLGVGFYGFSIALPM